ncbi:MAG: segregation/condensation protein A [Candidatus Omnitrophota bacterium]
MTYKVKLDLFEGPLDLLLHLIKKSEIDIYDIPITSITEQYLHYMDFMQMLDLNIAGEFLVMAATLIHIKSRMLLPQPEVTEEASEELDPREELVQRLLEYKRFKEVAIELSGKAAIQKDYFGRRVTFSPSDLKGRGEANEEEYFEASLFDLITAFTKVMKEVPKQLFYQVIKDEFTVEEKMHDIFHLLVKKTRVQFGELFRNAENKVEVITTFLALLELIRLKEIMVMQSKVFGDIVIQKNTELMHPPAKNE